MKNTFFLLALLWVSGPAVADEGGEILAAPAIQEEMGYCSETACPRIPVAQQIDFAEELRTCLVSNMSKFIDKKTAKGHLDTMEAINEEVRLFNNECSIYAREMDPVSAKLARRKAAEDILNKYDGV